jgi:hypothetical protein
MALCKRACVTLLGARPIDILRPSGTWRYEICDGFTQYGGARTHTFAAVKIAPAGI